MYIYILYIYIYCISTINPTVHQTKPLVPHPPVPPHCLSPLFGPSAHRGAAIGARLDPCGSRVPPGSSRNGHRCLVNAQKMRKNWGRNQLLWIRFFLLCVCKRLPNMDVHSCAKYLHSRPSYYRTIVISPKCTAKMFRVWPWCKFAGWGIRAFWRLTSTIVLTGVHHEKHKCTTREKGTVTMMKPWNNREIIVKITKFSLEMFSRYSQWQPRAIYFNLLNS